jgi:CRISPR-associated protein Csx17
MSQHRLPLPGCAPIPLAHYLKALGILRLVAEDREHGDPDAAGCWERDVFILHSRLDREGLLDFFLRHYQPTPIVVPWSGSDFFAVNREHPAKLFTKSPTSSAVIEAILSSASARLQTYRTAVRRTFGAMDLAGVTAKKAIEGSGRPQRRLKADLLSSLRGSLPDGAVAWIDAASVIEPDAPAFNALLGGGGGSDGNSHFSDNFMQCLWMALPEFDAQRQKPLRAAGEGCVFNSGRALAEALDGTPRIGTRIPGLSPVLFDSTRVGGPNQTSGFAATAASNPWDFVLMIEGSVLFAGAIGRKLDGLSEASARFPFLFQASPVGLGCSYSGEPAGRELWLPLWSRPTPLAEVRALLAEGRVEKHGRMARRGADAFVAAAQLGFDRGIDAFQRVGLFKGRIGGDNYFTTVDQGRIAPRRNRLVDLLRDADDWLSGLVPLAKTDNCPAGVMRASVEVERQIASLALAPQEQRRSRLLAVLTALGQAERALARSLRWATGRDLSPRRQRITPLSGLSARWLREADDGSAEFRLAAALASVSGSYKDKDGRPAALPLRQHLEAVALRGGTDRRWFAWDDPPSNDVVWREGDFADVLNAILARRLIRAEQAGHSELPDHARCFAPLADVVAFLEGRTDDDLLADLLWGLCLRDWLGETGSADFQSAVSRISNPQAMVSSDALPTGSRRHGRLETCATPEVPSALFSMLRLAFPRGGENGGGSPVPAIPMIHRHAAAGNGAEASRLAVRRLRGSGLHPALNEVAVSGEAARRAAAALLFPLSRRDFARVGELVLKPQTENQTNT